MKFVLSTLAIFLVSALRYTQSTFYHQPGNPSGQVPLNFARTPVFREGRIPSVVGSPYEESVLVFRQNPNGRSPVGTAGFRGGSISLKTEPIYFGVPTAHRSGCSHRNPGGFNVGEAGISGIGGYPFAEIGSPAQSVDIVRFLTRKGATVGNTFPSVPQSFDRGPRYEFPVSQYWRH